MNLDELDEALDAEVGERRVKAISEQRKASTR